MTPSTLLYLRTLAEDARESHDSAPNLPALDRRAGMRAVIWRRLSAEERRELERVVGVVFGELSKNR